ncbi:MAG: aminoacyl-tRNA hydrolase [Proteobacteria bacterium]|nr:aminoacyl-tRNA hydrolase [Pseudomonadota bacterium]
MEITTNCAIPDSEITYEFMRSSGPGGQNVNKVESAVRLKFDLKNNRSLPEEVKARLFKIAGNRITKSGMLTLVARRSRRQDKNRKDAIKRLRELVEQASRKPKPFKKTAVPLRSKLNRLDSKKRRSQQKQLRRTPSDTE